MPNTNTDTSNKQTNDIDCSRCKYTSPGCLGVLCEVGKINNSEKNIEEV